MSTVQSTSSFHGMRKIASVMPFTESSTSVKLQGATFKTETVKLQGGDVGIRIIGLNEKEQYLSLKKEKMPELIEKFKRCLREENSYGLLGFFTRQKLNDKEIQDRFTQMMRKELLNEASKRINDSYNLVKKISRV